MKKKEEDESEGARSHICLTGVVDSVVECFRAPERIRIVELEKVNSRAGVLMRACVDLLVAITAVDGHDFVCWGSVRSE